MSKVVCEFCNITVKDKYTIKTHLLKNKTCLKIRGMTLNTNFICIGCNNMFSSNINLVTHTESCKQFIILKTKEECKIEYDKLKDQYNQLEDKTKQYEAKLAKFEDAVIASAKSNTTINYNTNSNNTNSNNVNSQYLNLSKEHLEPLLRQNLTFDHAKRGQRGLANMVVTNLLKNEEGQLLYQCTDTARQNFEFINEQGDTEKDVRAAKLIQALLDSKVEVIASEVGSKGWEDDNEKFKIHNRQVTEIMTLGRDNTAFRTQLTSLTS